MVLALRFMQVPIFLLFSPRARRRSTSISRLDRLDRRTGSLSSELLLTDICGKVE
ncbi:hypothetical protein D3C78_1956400 [compost metagenome]